MAVTRCVEIFFFNFKHLQLPIVSIWCAAIATLAKLSNQHFILNKHRSGGWFADNAQFIQSSSGFVTNQTVAGGVNPVFRTENMHKE
jgi:hypothetical protein